MAKSVTPVPPAAAPAAQNVHQLDLFAASKKPGARLLSFDLETQNSFDDVGGRDNLGALKMSVGITYDPDKDRFEVYPEQRARELIDDLLDAQMVVGFNVRRFDYRVLEPYAGGRDLSKIKTLDLLEKLETILGHRVKLDSCATATLGTQKSGHGLQAIEWFRTGQMSKLIDYCKDDVKITWQVYEHGRKNKHIFITDRNGGKRRVDVDW